MKVVRSLEGIQKTGDRVRGLVPTMGAFHEGHLSLMRKARTECDEVVVSLFVNPLQFGPTEDLSRYPRQEERDSEMAESAGVDLLFIPAAEEIIRSTRANVTLKGLSDHYEGAHRPGHFDGVATIVAKLFHIISPDVAYFGLKDRQQCAVIQAMTEDLNFPLKLSFQPTIRDRDGLALSSRNVYLSPEERRMAPSLYSTMRATAERIAKGASVLPCLVDAREQLSEEGFAVDYFDLIDPRTFEAAEKASLETVIVAAAKLGKTRLIDNIDAPFRG